mmetsp:Transcript_10715/g.49304  ORF Transcript_10715/g.49304 Transcript_10715/m.49304 type:complete len:260 (-) Transcript_10715:2181-2960(-)
MATLMKHGSFSKGARKSLVHCPPTNTLPVGSLASTHSPSVRYTSRLVTPFVTTGATMTSFPTANWSWILYVFSSSGASHHIGLHMGSSECAAASVKFTNVSTTFSRISRDFLVRSAASAPTSHGANENCSAGIKAFACAHRTISSRSGNFPKYALPPIMSGRQNGYPVIPLVSSVGMMDRRPLPVPQSLNLSPIRVSVDVPVVWCPVRTSASSNRAATFWTQHRVYSLGCVRDEWVRKCLGRKHGSPASNLYPSIPYRV